MPGQEIPLAILDTLPHGVSVHRCNSILEREIENIQVEHITIASENELKESSKDGYKTCLLYTSPSPRDATLSRMPSSA